MISAHLLAMVNVVILYGMTFIVNSPIFPKCKCNHIIIFLEVCEWISLLQVQNPKLPRIPH